MLHIIRNSGHDYNDFGRYRDCRTVHHMNYFLVSILDKFPVPMAVGLCLPEECALADVDNFKPTLLRAIQSALPNMLEEVRGFENVNTTLTEADIRIVSPELENAKITKFTKESFFVCTLIFSVAVVGLSSTCYLWKQRQDEVFLQNLHDQGSEGSLGSPVSVS